MIGLISNIKGREYRIINNLIIGFILEQDRFHIEGGGYICFLQRIEIGAEFEFRVANFKEPTEKLSEINDFSVVDVAFEEELYSEENQKRLKLMEFKKLEAILRKEGRIT